MKAFWLIAAVLFLGGCSTLDFDPAYYSTKDLTGKDHFEVTLKLPKKYDSKTEQHFAARAIGEECLKRDFKYFEWRESSDSKFVGNCRPTDEKKALGLSFSDAGLDKNPRQFIVDAISPEKRNSKVLVNDQILEINKTKIASMADVTNQVFEASKKQENVRLKLIRNGKTIEVTEPFATMKGGVLGPSDLTSMRNSFF